MKYILLSLLCLLATLRPANSASSDPLCVGKVPDYVRLGSDGMVLTEEAQDILCRDDNTLLEWDGNFVAGAPTFITNMVVHSSAVVKALQQGAELQFSGCVFPEELHIEGGVAGSVIFRASEFRGNFDIHGAQFSGQLSLASSVLHQGFHIADASFLKPVEISGSVLTGGLEMEHVILGGGLRLFGTRVVGSTNLAGVRSPAGLTFDDGRFAGMFVISEPEVTGGVRFRGCEWDQTSLISFSSGIIGGGIRFDSCGFDSRWLPSDQEQVPLIRLSELTVGSPVVLANASSRRFPRLKVSRSVMPFLKLPEWRISKHILLGDTSELSNEREMEEAAELLQLAKSGYDAQGRTRDSLAAKSEHRMMIARIKGGPELIILLARKYFGTGVWWFLAIVSIFSLLFGLMGIPWHVYEKTDKILVRLYKVIDLSVSGFFKGPPKENGVSSISLSVAAQRVLMMERLLGVVFLFLFGAVLNEWIRGS